MFFFENSFATSVLRGQWQRISFWKRRCHDNTGGERSPLCITGAFRYVGHVTSTYEGVGEEPVTGGRTLCRCRGRWMCWSQFLQFLDRVWTKQDNDLTVVQSVLYFFPMSNVKYVGCDVTACIWCGVCCDKVSGSWGKSFSTAMPLHGHCWNIYCSGIPSLHSPCILQICCPVIFYPLVGSHQGLFLSSLGRHDIFFIFLLCS